ncbi:MAG: hypothetical protein RIM99_18370 [Cyclobacteriaceae bacterium]
MNIKNCIAILVILSGCQTVSQEENSDRKYRIAYNVWIDPEGDNYDVFSMNMDGSDPVNITNLDGVEWTYKSSGQDLLFISDKDTCDRCYLLYSSDAFGRDPKRIGGFLLKDSWHSTRKNGEEIIVTPKVENDSAFYILNRNGELVQKIYTGLAYFTDPEFSPDGTQIVFRGAQKRFKANIGYQDELYVVNTDGTGLRQLTYYPENDTTAEWWNYHAGPPFWEPNQNIITFHSVQQGGSYLFQINPDGSGLKKLTPDSLRVGWHSWSSNGEIITFDAETGTDEQPDYDIFSMHYRTGKITQLTFDSLYQQSPVVVEVRE